MQFADKFLELTAPKVMGILNVTPDSFSDGGQFNQLDNALSQAESMLSQGADIIDVGGESTRPGAPEVSVQQELDRVIPVIEAIATQFDSIISVDTSKPEVMEAALNAGAGLINDVRALQLPGALEVAGKSNAAVCLMHMQGQPATMQAAPTYQDVVDDITTFFQQRIHACIQAGISDDQIILDPGFGFGKTLTHNYQLLAEFDTFANLGCPLLAGISRKSMLGKLLNRDIDDRLAGSIAAATIAAMKGAKIIRAHDVQETVDAVRIVAQLAPYS